MLNSSKRKKYSKIAQNNFTIILIFAFLSFVSSVLLLRANFVGNAWNLYFHWSRIYELKGSISNGDFMPKILLSRFGEIGTIAMTMYPKMNLYPVVFLSYFIKSQVTLIYIVFMLRNFLALLIGYFSCYHFNKNKNISFIFSVSYVISNVVLYYGFNSMDMGVTSSLIFLPMVLFGTLELIDNNNWKELTIGISAVVLCHVITTLLAVIMVLSLVATNLICLKRKKFWISGAKIILFSILITSVFWIPFIVVMLNNNLRMPSEIILSGTDLNSLLSSVMNNQVNHFISIVAFLGIVLGILNYKKMNSTSKRIFWISIVFLFIASPFFPWILLNDTSLKSTFQYSWRVYNIPQILLVYIFSSNSINLCKNKKQMYVMTLLITFSVVMLQLIGQKEVIMEGQGKQYNFNDLNKSTLITDDYAPQKYLPVRDDISKHIGFYDRNNKLNVELLGDGKFDFHLKKNAQQISLPFFIYNGIDYQVKVDKKINRVNSNKYSELTVNNLDKGQHVLQVNVRKSWYDYLSYILSIFGLLTFIYTLIRDNIIKLKYTKF